MQALTIRWPEHRVSPERTRYVWDIPRILENNEQNFTETVHPILVIDEQLAPYRESVSLLEHVQSKSDKYAFKILLDMRQ